MANEDADNAIEFHDVAIGYEHALAVQEISSVVNRGDSVAIIGPNGAGKTTLMKAVTGLLPVASGRIVVLGHSPESARRQVAYVQQVSALDAQFPVSAFDVVLMGRYRSRRWWQRLTRQDRELASEALAMVKMDDRAKTRFGALSGGQRQRVLLARAIAQQSELLLLDEPFNGVDVTSVELCLDALAQLRKSGVTLLMSTHDLELARATCDKVLLVNRTQRAFGSTTDVLTPALLSDTFGAKSLAWGGPDASIITTG